MKIANRNIPYILFLAFVIPSAFFFIAEPLVQAAKAAESSLSIDYNTSMTLNNYHIKISDMVYITDTAELAFAFSVVAESTADEDAYPYLTNVTSYNKSGKSTEYSEFYTEERNDISQYAYFSGVENDFRYVRVYAFSTIPGYQDEPTADEFGDVIEGEIHEEESSGVYCQVDKKDILFMTSDEAADYLAVKENVYDAEEDGLYDDVNSVSEEFDEYEDVELMSGAGGITSAATTTTATSEETSDEASSEEFDDNSEELTQSKSEESAGTVAQTEAQTAAETVTEAVQETAETQAQTQTETAVTTKEAATTTTTKQTTAAKKTTAAAKQTTTTTSAAASSSATKLSLSGGDVTLSAGQTASLTVNAEPSGANLSLTWTSNKTDVATVSGGKVTAVSSGKAIITVTDLISGLSASCMITVE